MGEAPGIEIATAAPAHEVRTPNAVARAVAEDFLAARAGDPRAVPLVVHRDDPMFRYALDAAADSEPTAWLEYLQAGLAGARTAAAVRAAAPAGAMLDLASGYGRVTRHLVRTIPAETLWVSDLLAEAIDFQARAFGVRPLLSDVDPAAFAPSGVPPFALVTAFSLFSHLPAGLFEGWLARLRRALAPGGVLAFSTWDVADAPPALRQGSGPVLFQPVNEDDRLATASYGTTWVREAWVREALARAFGPGVAARRVPHGLWSSQDLWIASDDPAAVAAPVLPDPPIGYLDGAWQRDETLQLAGWAIGAAPPVAVEATIDGVPVAATTADEPRPDVGAVLGRPGGDTSGWFLAVPAPLATAGSRLRVTAVDAGGEATVLWAGLVGAAPSEIALKTRPIAEGQRLLARDATIGELRGALAAATARRSTRALASALARRLLGRDR